MRSKQAPRRGLFPNDPHRPEPPVKRPRAAAPAIHVFPKQPQSCPQRRGLVGQRNRLNPQHSSGSDARSDSIAAAALPATTGVIDDGRKIWKLSPMDLKSYGRWYDYSRARDDMFKATDTPWAPWYVIRSDDKKRARLNAITHLLRRIEYKEAPRDKVKLPDRQKPHGYKEPDYPYKFVPELTWPSG